MKNIISLVAVCLIAFSSVTLVHAQERAASAKPSADNPLAPLAFLTEGEWEAKLPPQPNGQQVSILAHFSWANNYRAVRISNVYAVKDKTVPYIEGLYAWNPQKKAIVFTYVDSKGNFYEGTVRPLSDGLLHEFVMIDSTGGTTQYSARQTRSGDNAWVNEISEIKDGKPVPEVTVRYEKK